MGKQFPEEACLGMPRWRVQTVAVSRLPRKGQGSYSLTNMPPSKSLETRALILPLRSCQIPHEHSTHSREQKAASSFSMGSTLTSMSRHTSISRGRRGSRAHGGAQPARSVSFPFSFLFQF